MCPSDPCWIHVQPNGDAITQVRFMASPLLELLLRRPVVILEQPLQITKVATQHPLDLPPNRPTQRRQQPFGKTALPEVEFKPHLVPAIGRLEPEGGGDAHRRLVVRNRVSPIPLERRD